MKRVAAVADAVPQRLEQRACAGAVTGAGERETVADLLEDAYCGAMICSVHCAM